MAAFQAKIYELFRSAAAGKSPFWIGAGVAGAAFAVAVLSIVLPRGGDREASLGAWDRVASVLQHRRCLNCHQSNEPLQGDNPRRHTPRVVRGHDNQGAPGMRCSSCHGEQRNNEASRVPGAAHWKFAPRSMSWAGLSAGALCRTIKDPAKNGGRSPRALVKHVEDDSLIHWAWAPGGERKPIPIPHYVFVEFVDEWVRTGAHCPD